VGCALALSACSTLPPAAPPDAKAPPLDFRLIYHLAEVYASVRFDPPEGIRARWSSYYERLEIVELRQTRNLYLLGTLPGGRQLEIVVRGTVNLKNSLYDARIRRHWNRELGIFLHSGFEAMALALQRDILPRLDRGCELILMGHSLGAAEALILGLLLDHEGFRVGMVYASGQPRVTDAAGARKYGSFPVLRIASPEDPVPLLPKRGYRHLGPALILLDGPYFCFLPGDYLKESLPGAVRTNEKQGERILEQFREHSILDYFVRLQPKLDGTVQVPFAERFLYLRRPRAGGEP
jgi:hypothetical protein